MYRGSVGPSSCSWAFGPWMPCTVANAARCCVVSCSFCTVVFVSGAELAHKSQKVALLVLVRGLSDHGAPQEVYLCPMCIVMLRISKIGSPFGDMRDFKPVLLKQLHIIIGWVPYAQAVICMVDKVHLPIVRQRRPCEERGRQSYGC